MTPLQQVWRSVGVFAERGDLDAADLLPYRNDPPTIEIIERISSLFYAHHKHVAWFEDVCCRGIEDVEKLRRELT